MVADSFRSEQECGAELALVWKQAKEGKGNCYEVDGYLFHRDKILVDQHTRWGEAVPLTSLSAKVTCESLLSIFSRIWIPNTVASDNGKKIAAKVTKEFGKRIGSSPRLTSRYMQSNGLADKCSFTAKRIKYLGHTMGGGKHGSDEDNVLAIKSLIRPSTKKEVHCDASDYGVGCCLRQQDIKGIYRPIAFASQKIQCDAKELDRHQ
ncbi:integrase catalytic domain-containing protein [Trichonephila clavipes]|uniref:Integrase catalytic domain-containing protein n=1 Tax=Trichonephila clavipes TaxID=2585209 RepID=A0A8X6W4G8_TRICX|nr:integrase catalytic domain-containing protein [Trichonephila clavipes]